MLQPALSTKSSSIAVQWYSNTFGYQIILNLLSQISTTATLQKEQLSNNCCVQASFLTNFCLLLWDSEVRSKYYHVLQFCDDQHHCRHCNRRWTTSYLSQEKQQREESCHKALRCTSDLHVSLVVTWDLEICTFQSYLYYKARVSGLSLVLACPSADSQKKVKFFAKTQRPLFTIFPGLRGNICTCGRK